jgi:SH3-like domain-containing protein
MKQLKCLAGGALVAALYGFAAGSIAASAAETKPAPKPAPSAAQTSASAAQDEMPDEAGGGDAKGTAAGLPIPRFVSLRTNPINLRTGPGVRYPVDWVYVKRSLPVEVIGEFDTWRRIRDQDGAEGWVHQSMLSGKRTAVVKGVAAALKRTGEDTADLVATLEPGVVVNVQRCPAATATCRVEVEGFQGWMKRDQLWGVYPTETLQ